jgi:hypothetical protein
LHLALQVGFFFHPALYLNRMRWLNAMAPFAGNHGQDKPYNHPIERPRLHAHATFIRNHLLKRLLPQWPLLDIENVLLEPVAGGHDCVSTFPSPPSPPSKTIWECDLGRWSASTGGMLKVIALARLAILEKSPVEMIVQPFA